MSTINSLYWGFLVINIFALPRIMGSPLHLQGYMYVVAFFYLLATLLVLLA